MNLIVSLTGLISCQQKGEVVEEQTRKPTFDSIPSTVLVAPVINETSGIADSKKNTGYLWVQEDSGNPPQLTLINYNGAVQKNIHIKGAVNRDWEDMVLAGSHIYVGDIGDNNGVYPDYTLYKFSEPSSTVDTVNSFETIRFKYSDGSHDAEAFLVDPISGAIYIITKRDNPSRIYKLTPPFTAPIVYTAQEVGQLFYPGVVSAAISTDGKEIIIKTYFSLQYYKKLDGETIEATLQKSPLSISYLAEPQGEAVCFRSDDGGYFTLSEKGMGAEVRLYFYKRN